MAKSPEEPKIDCELQPQSNFLPEPQLLPEPQNQPLPEPQNQPLPEPQNHPLPEPQLQSQPNTHPETQTLSEEQLKPCVWKHHHRFLLLLLGSSFCLSILALAYFFLQHIIRQSSPAAFPPCTTPACQRAATRLATSVDPFARPCDYFLYTCGSKDAASPLNPSGNDRSSAWVERERGEDRRTVRREDASVDRMPGRVDALLQKLREILESEDSSSPSDSAKQKARRFYRSCMDTESTEAAGPEPFLLLLRQLGGWAVSGQWNKTDFNSTLSLLMREYATFPFFNVYVGKDPNDTDGDKRYIQIDQPHFQIPIEWSSKTLKSKANTQSLRPFLASCQMLLALLGSPSSSTGLHLGLFMSLSSELAVLASPLAHRKEQGLLYQRLTIKELQTVAPAIDWLGCLQASFHPHRVSQSDHVLLHNLPYIIHMSKIIGNWLTRHEMSGSGPLHTFMIFSLLHTVIPALDSRFSQTEKNFSLALGTKEEDIPRWRTCVLQTEKGFNMVLTNLLREATTYIEAEEMIQNVFSSIKSKLSDVRWTDLESRLSVMKKISSLTPRLEYSTFSEAELNDQYLKVTVGEHKYFSNYIQALSLQQQRRNQLLSQTKGADILSITPFVSSNDLIFPMGMFVQPYFHPTYPRAINFGMLGTLMAKDILHLLLPNIYSQSDSPRSIGQCVWSQYLNVTESSGTVGPLSPKHQQEVWVQYSALQVALQAYIESLKKYPKDFALSGLSHTHLFLTSFTQINCDSDPYHEFMPFEPSFLVTVICGNSDLCPLTIICPDKPKQHFLQTC